MSISGINSSVASSIYASISSISSDEISTDLTNKAEELEAILGSEGVDQETQDAIQEELALAIQDMFEQSDGEMPSCEEMKSTIDTIFSNHGLDAEEMLGGRMGAGGASDHMQTLLDMLEGDDDDDEANSATSIQQLAEELSQMVMDLVIGIDEEA